MLAGAGEDEKVGGLLDGADDYLPKPFSSKELIARCHLQMQMGKKRIDLERRFAARTLELHVRAVEAEEKRREAEEQRRQQEVSRRRVSNRPCSPSFPLLTVPVARSSSSTSPRTSSETPSRQF